MYKREDRRKEAAVSIREETGKKCRVVGENCAEVIVAGKAREQKETIYEMAALLYHGRQMVEAGRLGGTRLEEPSRRHIIDHKVKQEKMTQ